MTTPPRPSGNVVVVAVVVVFCFTLSACVAVFIAAPEGANTGSLITNLLGTLAPTIAALALLVKVSSTEAKVDQVAEDTYRLTNGLLDSKVRAGVADVLPDDLIDPDARDLIERDRAHRKNGGPGPDDDNSPA